MSGRVVHLEIPLDEADRARSFYKELFGWQVMEISEIGPVIVIDVDSIDDNGRRPDDIVGLPADTAAGCRPRLG